ncbi:MAG: magnesium transporter CorA family protein [Actinomycetota bacterium]|nr:magnesium transporter CorA family protein [Actinomycetota bacterium]
MEDDDGTVRGRVWRDGKVVAEDFDFEKISDHLENGECLTWVDICDPDHRILQELAGELVLEPLAVEDAIAHSERAKATRYASHTFITLYAVKLNPNAESPAAAMHGCLSVHKVSAFVFPRGLITVRSGPDFDIEEVVRRWDDNADLLKYGVGALVHGLLDTIVDGHFEAVQILDDAMEGLEDGLFDDRAINSEVQRATYRVRKDLVELRRVVLPMREVINSVLRHRKDFHSPSELDPWYDDLYDHVLRASEWTESLRDMISTIFETNLSLQDARLNTVMRKLTGWAAIIAVPTAVTGYFGQNLPYPGFGKHWGFALSVAVILTIGIGLFICLKRKKWI